MAKRARVQKKPAQRRRGGSSGSAAAARLEARSYPIVGIGASAGGFEAFSQLLQALPSETGMAFVFVQHLDPEHQSMLARLFSNITEMPVTEARNGMAVEPNHVYVIPPKSDLGIHNGGSRWWCGDGRAVASCRSTTFSPRWPKTRRGARWASSFRARRRTGPWD